MAESSERTLTPDEVTYVAAARDKAFVLYEGVRTPHRSCGIALAETFGLPTPAYQSLRRGGITGKGACGAIRAGEQVLGELLGDPSPTGAVTPALREAVTWYQEAWKALRFAGQAAPDIVCDTLVRPHGDFLGPARKAFCTNLAADVAALTAEALCRFGSARPDLTPLEL
ncbi:MAG: C-GCAxxG-C-C family protein [Myxococcales bacterium]|nr:C-GCAxxG-C-C family protein [Myxococcales bacterium]